MNLYKLKLCSKEMVVLNKCILQFFNRKFATKPLLSKKKDFHSFAVFKCFIATNSPRTKDFSSQTLG